MSDKEEPVRHVLESMSKQWEDSLAAITQMTLEEVAYSAIKERCGIEREQVASLECNLMDGVLYVDAVIILESPLIHITVTMAGVNDDDAEEDEAVGEAG
jgi:hypothetical protein